jgi:hypothetical protein
VLTTAIAQIFAEKKNSTAPKVPIPFIFLREKFRNQYKPYFVYKEKPLQSKFQKIF